MLRMVWHSMDKDMGNPKQSNIVLYTMGHNPVLPHRVPRIFRVRHSI